LKLLSVKKYQIWQLGIGQTRQEKSDHSTAGPAAMQAKLQTVSH
jgi:hypothetical protein